MQTSSEHDTIFRDFINEEIRSKLETQTEKNSFLGIDRSIRDCIF